MSKSEVFTKQFFYGALFVCCVVAFGTWNYNLGITIANEKYHQKRTDIYIEAFDCFTSEPNIDVCLSEVEEELFSAKETKCE